MHGADLTFNTGLTGSSGTPTGIVAITDNADLTAGGTASGPQNNGQIAISLTNGSGSVNVGSSNSITVTVLIPGSTTLSSIAVVTQGASGLDFTSAGVGTCVAGTSYAAGATCTVPVVFTPKFVGTRYGAVVLSNSSGVAGTTYLQGTGVGRQTAVLPSAPRRSPLSMNFTNRPPNRLSGNSTPSCSSNRT